MRRLVLILPLLLICSCSSGSGESLRVATASSLTDVMGEVTEEYVGRTGRKGEPSFGASSTLARQIADGAPADVYISASKKWIEFLQDKDLVVGSPVVIARNRLVCVAPKDSEIKVSGFHELAASDALIAVGDEGVPAGEYARQALEKSGVLNELQKRLVGQQDVRSVVKAVESGNAPVGFVYSSDAYQFAETLRVLFVVDAELHDRIEYYAVELKNAEHPDGARGFLMYLQSEKVEKKFAMRGFVER